MYMCSEPRTGTFQSFSPPTHIVGVVILWTLFQGDSRSQRSRFSQGRRSWPLGTGRISPARPISPKVTRSVGNGLFLKLDNAASSNAVSAPVSVTRTPPTTLTNTS